MNGLSINCRGGRRAHKERISVAWIKVFGQKVEAEIPVLDFVEEGRGGSRQVVMESYGC